MELYELSKEWINHYNSHEPKLIKAGYLNPNELYLLGSGTEFDKVLYQRYRFFQDYLDNGAFNIKNGYYLFGTEDTFNAWACSNESINIVLINAKVIICNSLFYGSNYELQIENILRQHRIKTSYCNGVATIKLMRQLMEIFLFYHEVGHLIQSWNPPLVHSKIEENKKGLEYNEIDHIAEIDADMFAYNRIASHIKLIVERGSENKKDTEKLCSVLIASYLLYRSILLGDFCNFYTKEYHHPHLLIRMWVAISSICNAVNKNVNFEIDSKLIIELSLKLLDGLCFIHPEINGETNFVEMSIQNKESIAVYYNELTLLTKEEKGTTYEKRERYLQ